MAESRKPVKAQLIELDATFQEKSGGKRVTIQFNPETLKVSYANQIVQPTNAGGEGGSGAGGSGDQSQQSSGQFVGAGTTKLSIQIWFDVNAPLPEGKQGTIDVRELTKDVAYFITPIKSDRDPNQFVPPAVRFLWGSFHFDGIVESLEESLEFFSDDGLPLRASITMGLTQQKIEAFEGRKGGQTSQPPGTGPAPGTRPLAQAPAGSSLQGMVDVGGGAGVEWQKVASANAIENPRLLEPGRLIDVNAQVRVR